MAWFTAICSFTDATDEMMDARFAVVAYADDVYSAQHSQQQKQSASTNTPEAP